MEEQFSIISEDTLFEKVKRIDRAMRILMEDKKLYWCWKDSIWQEEEYCHFSPDCKSKRN